MALYDDYFTNDDKPFAENLNDALLLSNVFDMTVPIQIPKMFSNSTWVSTTSPRKCGVAILTLKEGLPSGVSVGTDSGTGNSTLTGTGTVKLSFYPNFNSFGKFKSMTWENTGTIVVNLKTTTGTTIASNISKGTIENQSSDLRTLQEIVIEIVFTNATLKSFEVVMENKQQTRYGADVGISDVTGLEERLSSIETFDSNIFNLIYPVGSIYMSVNSTSPATLFGGTWEQVKDRFLLSAGNTYTNGNTGGEATHKLTQNEMPSHTHTQNSHTHTQNAHRHEAGTNNNFFLVSKSNVALNSTNRSWTSSSESGVNYVYVSPEDNVGGINEDLYTAYSTATNQSTTATNQDTGGSQAHNNMPPYLVVNVWKRTA